MTKFIFIIAFFGVCKASADVCIVSYGHAPSRVTVACGNPANSYDVNSPEKSPNDQFASPSQAEIAAVLTNLNNQGYKIITQSQYSWTVAK